MNEENQLMLNYMRNKAYAKSADSYSTTLDPVEEQKFRNWVTQNKVPFNPDQKLQDYDMRGFWKSGAGTAVDPNDQRIHYPDTFKTPYHQTFSAESQWAAPGAPSWNNKDQLVLPNGKVIFDDRVPH